MICDDPDSGGQSRALVQMCHFIVYDHIRVCFVCFSCFTQLAHDDLRQRFPPFLLIMPDLLFVSIPLPCKTPMFGVIDVWKRKQKTFVHR